MRNFYLIIITIFLGAISISAQEVKGRLIISESNTEMTVLSDSLRKEGTINDYSMLGVHYGVALNNAMWNPIMDQNYLFTPINMAVTYTKYGKMFNYMPYFGFQASLLYTKEGYLFKKDKKTGITQTMLGATKAILEVVELPILAHIHFDFWKMKLLLNVGCYGGYRIGIERFGENVLPEIKNSFSDTDIRFDYGLKGGVGFGLVFAPLEVHIQGMYKYSMSSYFQPNHKSEYYYQYGYPNSIAITVGLHIHLTKRLGKTKAAIRRQAKKELGLILEDTKNEE